MLLFTFHRPDTPRICIWSKQTGAGLMITNYRVETFPELADQLRITVLCQMNHFFPRAPEKVIIPY